MKWFSLSLLGVEILLMVLQVFIVLSIFIFRFYHLNVFNIFKSVIKTFSILSFDGFLLKDLMVKLKDLS